MRARFENYLIACGYSSVTPSGNPSTVYAYIKRIDCVCEREHTDWNGLAEQIDRVIHQYGIGGSKEDYGNISHRTVINALKCFANFLKG